MSLYQSYRPKNFSDVVGQDFVKKILANSCKTRTFHHGYIFFGFHGIGKTTLARIFAEGINCTNITPEGNPCHTCSNCIAYDTGKMIDVIEIDAASHTSIENIKEIIEHAKFTPTQGQYKVYIIDEIHMLSAKAFNALLKTIEEPPTHVIFLLATTQINAVPETILSRVIRFDLTKIGEKDMYDLLAKIVTREGITYEETAIKMIVHRARGSIRDSLTMLEKCIIGKSVTEKNVEEALHLVNMSFLRETFDACVSGDGASINHILSTINNEGIDVRQFAAQMTEWIVDTIDEAFEKKMFPLAREIFDLFTHVFVQSKQVAVPMDVLRMALYARVTHGSIAIPKGQENTESDPPLPDVKNVSEENPKGEIPETPNRETKHEESLREEEKETSSSPDFSPENYLQKLQELGMKSTMIPLLKTAIIRLEGDTLLIETTTFCQSRCAETSIRQVLENAARAFHAEKIKIIVPDVSDSEESPKEESIEDVARAIFTD